jgi:hypothetical protein
MKFKPGFHVLTMQDPSGKEVPMIMLSWEEAKLAVQIFTPPPGKYCPFPRATCLPCGLRDELLAMIKERGPK